LHRDRDSAYSEAFRRRVAGMGITGVVSAQASPWQNPYAEHVIGSIRRECLNHVMCSIRCISDAILTIYRRYYHRTRTHLGLAKDAPDPRPVVVVSITPACDVGASRHGGPFAIEHHRSAAAGLVNEYQSKRARV